jgi:predicted transcriptional regulator
MVRKSTLDRGKLIRELMVKNNYNQSDIAKVLGVSPQAISQILNPHKQNARRIIGYDIKRNKITRPLNCSNCESPGRIEAHHPDHKQARNIIWLCKKCHMAIHINPDYNKDGEDLTACLENIHVTHLP